MISGGQTCISPRKLVQSFGSMIDWKSVVSSALSRNVLTSVFAGILLLAFSASRYLFPRAFAHQLCIDLEAARCFPLRCSDGTPALGVAPV